MSRVLLVTSRDTGRWVIPKGWPWPGLPDHEAAAAEAREEAGAIGSIDPFRCGTFCYGKVMAEHTMVVEVAVFRLEVADLLADWPEAHQRERRWFTIEEASAAVLEPGLSELIAGIDRAA